MHDLEFQVGLFNGEAVGYCPQTGHQSSVSLRRVANEMASRGELGEVGADLLDALDYADDRPQVGGKIGKKIKKGFKKVVAVAKKIAKSTLGKVVINALTMGAGSAAGAALSAVKSGIKTAKAAKSKKKTPAAARAKKAAPIAAQLAAKRITPAQAKTKSRAAGVPIKQVQSAALALRVQDAAKKGNVNARDLMRTAAAVERAEDNPQPLRVAPQQDAPGSSPFAFPPGGGDADADPGGSYADSFDDASPATELEDPLPELEAGDPFPELDQGDEMVEASDGAELEDELAGDFDDLRRADELEGEEFVGNDDELDGELGGEA